MDARNLTPTSTNFLSDRQFKFELKRTPNLNWHIQTVNIPGISSGTADLPNPFVKVPYPGDHLSFEELVITFRVNENLSDWLELFNWLKALGFPKEYSQYAPLVQPTTPIGEGVKSDISLVIMNSNRVPHISVVFKDAFPIQLSSLNFDSTKPSEYYIESTAVFRYSDYEIEIL